MPEGHTVHRLARTFGELFGNQQVSVSSPQGRFAAGAELLDGLELRASEAYGKQMFLGLAEPGAPAGSDLRWLRVHLGLYGAWTFAADASTDVVHAIGAPRTRVGERETVVAAEPGGGSAHEPGVWEPPPPRGAVRVRLVSEHASADLTGPTACEVLTPEAARAVQARLGPDPLRADASPEAFVTAVRRSRVAVGVQLMNQDVIAGVGNIYRAEVLFRAGQAPRAPGTTVPAAVLRQMWDDLVVLMADGARTGAIVTTRPEDRGPVAGRHEPHRRTRQNTDGTADAVPSEDAFYVYKRDGLPCRVCGTPVALAEVAGRNLFWCPRCQHEDAPA